MPATTIFQAVKAAVDGGAGADFNHPAAEDARRLTQEAGCVWTFTSWSDAMNDIQVMNTLGGVYVEIEY